MTHRSGSERRLEDDREEPGVPGDLQGQLHEENEGPGSSQAHRIRAGALRGPCHEGDRGGIGAQGGNLEGSGTEGPGATYVRTRRHGG